MQDGGASDRPIQVVGIDVLEQKLEPVWTHIGKLTEKVNQTYTKVKVIEERVDTQKKSLDDHKTNCSLKEKVDTVEGKIDGHIEEHKNDKTNYITWVLMIGVLIFMALELIYNGG